jgi:hypothetical protein
MANTQKLDTHHKALTLNLDLSTFGFFAEIGAGQEVARWLLLVGGASGTVAKAISAYDEEVSDDLYGAGSRYVSKQCIQAMLDKEWAELQTQVCKTRGLQTRFFSFADTVSARNYTGTNDANGWMRLRFQLQPGAGERRRRRCANSLILLGENGGADETRTRDLLRDRQAF